jgi:hypothetical protein
MKKGTGSDAADVVNASPASRCRTTSTCTSGAGTLLNTALSAKIPSTEFEKRSFARLFPAGLLRRSVSVVRGRQAGDFAAGFVEMETLDFPAASRPRSACRSATTASPPASSSAATGPVSAGRGRAAAARGIPDGSWCGCRRSPARLHPGRAATVRRAVHRRLARHRRRGRHSLGRRVV